MLCAERSVRGVWPVHIMHTVRWSCVLDDSFPALEIRNFFSGVMQMPHLLVALGESKRSCRDRRHPLFCLIIDVLDSEHGKGGCRPQRLVMRHKTELPRPTWCKEHRQ